MPLRFTSRLCEIAQASSITELWEFAVTAYQAIGFSSVHYGLSQFRTKSSLGDPRDLLLLSTHSAELAARHFYAAVCAKDDAPHPCAITVRFYPDQARAAAALTLIAEDVSSQSDSQELAARHGAEIQALAHLMHLRILQLPGLARGRILSARQCEALEWIADGKTSQDVALLMGISAAMVEKHLRLARDALEVETSTQAVAKASVLNLLFQRNLAAAQPCPA